MTMQVLKQAALLATVALLTAIVSIMAVSQSESTLILPNDSGEWFVSLDHVGRTVILPIRMTIDGAGTFLVDPVGITTLRPDIIQSSHFSVFDLIVRLGELGEIDLAYHYDEAMATHVIDSIDGEDGWWYEAHYSGGWFERNTQWMDQYLVKNETTIRLFKDRASRLSMLYEEFEEEVARLGANDGKVIIPRITIEGPRREQLVFENIEVLPHNTRTDLYQPGTITALDILLSLGEQGLLTQLAITWYDAIFTADPVDHYFVEHIQGEGLDAQAYGSCGFVYEVGYTRIGGFAGAHIHIPTDARVLVSPEYALWFWICL